MTEFTGVAICICPYCKKESEQEVTIDVEPDNNIGDLD